MTTTNTAAGLKVTYPYTTSPEVARIQCEECGKWSRSDERGGQIAHSKSKPQPSYSAPAVAAPALQRFASQVRRTGMTQGRDEDVYEAHRAGYLSTSDAMNVDD